IQILKGSLRESKGHRRNQQHTCQNYRLKIIGSVHKFIDFLASIGYLRKNGSPTAWKKAVLREFQAQYAKIFPACQHPRYKAGSLTPPGLGSSTCDTAPMGVF